VDIETLAKQVIRGNWGNGQARKDNLKRAGYSTSQISAIQARVNQILGVGQSAPAPTAPAPAAPTPAPVVTPTPAPVVTPPPVVVEPPPPPKPVVPKYLSSSPVQPVKYASPDVVLTDQNSLPVDLILKLTLEKIGGIELISLVRHDTVNGQDIAYQPVKNLAQIEFLYSPQNIVKIPDTSELYFKNFAIKLENHIPQNTNDTPPKIVDLDSEGRIVIDVFALKPDYEVEIQTVSLGKVFDDTIYDEDEDES
jgi:hypothetical protein